MDKSQLTAEGVNHQNLIKYCIIILALLFAIMMINVTLAPDSAYTKSDENISKINGGHPHIAVNDDVCMSTDCVEAAARLSSYMDSNVSPCEDFYQYSCGGWDKTHSIPSEQSSWDILGELAQKNYNYFLDFLSTEPNQNDSEAIVKAKRIFLACNNTDQIVKDELEAIKYIINITGGWDRTDVKQNKTWSINSNLPLERYHSSGAFFGISVASDDYNSSKADIEVTVAVSLGYTVCYCVLQQNNVYSELLIIIGLQFHLLCIDKYMGSIIICEKGFKRKTEKFCKFLLINLHINLSIMFHS